MSTLDGAREGQGRLTEHDLDDEVVIYDSDLAQAHALNSTAAAVWRRVDGLTTEEQIVERVAGDYGVHAEDIAGEVADLLDDLQERSLLTHRDPPRRRA